MRVMEQFDWFAMSLEFSFCIAFLFLQPKNPQHLQTQHPPASDFYHFKKHSSMQKDAHCFEELRLSHCSAINISVLNHFVIDSTISPV